MIVYPPGTSDEDFRLIPSRHRADAIQEAWVAHLEGRDPLAAAHAYRVGEARYERRQIPDSQHEPDKHGKPLRLKPVLDRKRIRIRARDEPAVSNK